MQYEFSAGGVVYRREKKGIQILVCQHAAYGHWGFPKGHIADRIVGETKEQAALREVTEETGVTAEILQELKPIEYWYERKGEKREKRVYFFLMEYTSGSITEHDQEMSAVEWVSEKKVGERLTYEGDKAVWAEARNLIAKE